MDSYESTTYYEAPSSGYDTAWQDETTSTGERSMSHGKKIRSYEQASGKTSYSRVPQPGMPTYTEAWALIEAARRMAVAADHADQANIQDRNKVRDALRLNWRLWTIFQAEMTADDKTLPEQIRVNMLTLCRFVDKHTVETLKDPVPDKVATLVDINRNIAAGLLESLDQDIDKGADAGGEPAEEAADAPSSVAGGGKNV